MRQIKKNYIVVLLILFTKLSFGQTQAEMNSKSIADYEKADKELNLVYKKVLNSMSSQTEKKLLTEAQVAWIKYKEAHCKSEVNEHSGGSIQVLFYHVCLEEITRERIVQLKKYLGK